MRNSLKKIAIIAGWLLLWQFVSLFIKNNIIMAGPVEVIVCLAKLLFKKAFWISIIRSFLRIMAGFLISAVAGYWLAFASYRWEIVGDILKPFIAVIRAVPVASVVVLLIIWFGSENLSLYVTGMVVFPAIYAQVIAGLKDTDVKLLELSKVTKMTVSDRYWYILRPQINPYVTGCLENSIGMSFKSGVAAEVIGLSHNSIGENIYNSKIYFDTEGLLAWTFALIILSFVTERGILIIYKMISNWHPKVTTRNSSAEAMVNVNLAVMENVSFSYDNCDRLLDNISFNIADAGILFIEGVSGKGKTSILRILAGLESATSGTVKASREKAFSFQDDRLIESLTGIENVLLTNRNKEKEEAVTLLERLGITASNDKKVSELSGGMKKRVSVARALLSDADMILLDEPFAGLDVDNKSKVAAIVREKAASKIILISIHNKEEIDIIKGGEEWKINWQLLEL